MVDVDRESSDSNGFLDFIKRDIENLDKDLAIIDERFQAMGIGTNVELYAGQGSFTDKKVAPLQKTKKS